MKDTIETQVIVIGGGSAGIAAAVAAGRHCPALLIEPLGILGGMGSASLVHTICGLYKIGTPDFANNGFPKEFATRLLKSGGASGPVRMGTLDVLLHEPTKFAALADQITAETKHLRVQKHTTLTSIKFESDHWLIETDKNRIRAQYLVDTSGDATAVQLSGHPYLREHESKLQRPAYIVKLSNIDPSALETSRRMAILHAIVKATQSGTLPDAALGCGIRQTITASDAFLTIDLDNPADILTNGRQLAEQITTWLAATIPGFENCAISAHPERPGIRESQRLLGRHILKEDQLISGHIFPDTIARTGWPIEMRETARGPKWRHFDQGHIPLSCLIARDNPRLFAAGRCLSASHRALGSLRVMGTCMATGEAAGLAAAILARNQSDAPADLTPLAQSVTECRQ
jgi:hypothetical protein